MRQLILVIALALSGCALIPKLEPGQNEAQVRQEMGGGPTRVIREADGGTRWQYATQPFGIRFMNVRFDAQGQVVDFWDGLDEAHLAQIRPGMSADEVTDRLGPHRSEAYFSLSGETVRDWNVDNYNGPGIATLFNVHLRDGVVVRTSRSFVYPLDVKFMGGVGGSMHMGSGRSGVGIGVGF
jgi:hypothetical protein